MRMGADAAGRGRARTGAEVAGTCAETDIIDVFLFWQGSLPGFEPDSGLETIWLAPGQDVSHLGEAGIRAFNYGEFGLSGAHSEHSGDCLVFGLRFGYAEPIKPL